jgi:hypothetical protein
MRFSTKAYHRLMFAAYGAYARAFSIKAVYHKGVNFGLGTHDRERSPPWIYIFHQRAGNAGLD